MGTDKNIKLHIVTDIKHQLIEDSRVLSWTLAHHTESAIQNGGKFEMCLYATTKISGDFLHVVS